MVGINGQNLPLYTEQGERLDWVKALKGWPEQTVRTLKVQLKRTSGGEVLAGWVHGYRLSEAKAREARQKCLKRNRKKGRHVKKETLFLAGWVLVFTTVSLEVLRAETIVKIYRIRWPIELAIKRMKGVLDLDKLRAWYESGLAEVWLVGKLLCVVLVDRRARRKVGGEWSS